MGFLEGFYYRPRVDKEILAKHSEGLIATSACLHGEIADWILKGDLEKAKAAASQYRDIFGEGNYYLEMMENGIPEQSLVNEKLMEISKELSIPLVATNDCHYLDRTDSEAHEVLLCIQTGKTMDDPGRMQFATDAFYLKSPDEMKQLFAYCPEAIENTVVIAEKCNLKLDFSQVFLPHFEIGQGRSLDEHLQEMAKAGLEQLMPKILQGSGPIAAAEIRKTPREGIGYHQVHGVCRLLSYRLRLYQLRQEPQHPRRSRARLSCRKSCGLRHRDHRDRPHPLWPVLRALPEPGPQEHARHRHRLLHGGPGRGHPVCFREIRQRPRGPDHHLREDAGKAVIRDVGRALNMAYGGWTGSQSWSPTS